MLECGIASRWKDSSIKLNLMNILHKECKGIIFFILIRRGQSRSGDARCERTNGGVVWGAYTMRRGLISVVVKYRTFCSIGWR